MGKPAIKYTPEHIAEGIRLMGEIRGAQIDAGTHPGMLSTLAQPVVMDNHHCVSCGEKQDFQVENEETMPNGALRRTGTCQACGGVISKFVKGAKPKSKAG